MILCIDCDCCEEHCPCTWPKFKEVKRHKCSYCPDPTKTRAATQQLQRAGIAFESRNQGTLLILNTCKGATRFYPVRGGLWQTAQGTVEGRGVKALVRWLNS